MATSSRPITVQFKDVVDAFSKIKKVIKETPCTKSSKIFGGIEVYYKKEFLQHTGSFKERGARYALLMLSEEERSSGVIAASAGNHALALSYHGQLLDIEVTVIMPKVAPMVKVNGCKKLGANVVIHGNDIGDSKEHALELAKEKKLKYINGYDDPHIIAGQGTIGLEIVYQVPDLDACIIPVGGGGMIAGMAVAIKHTHPHVQIIGVESERCASFSAAGREHKPTKTRALSSLADGLAVPTVGENAFVTADPLIDKMVSVKEEYIAEAILCLLESEKAIVEGAGASGLAVILKNLLPELEGKKVVIVLSGSNIDTTALGRVIESGLASDGRLVRFVVTIPDKAGGIADLTKHLTDLNVSIKHVQERASDAVEVTCVTGDTEDTKKLENALQEKYDEVLWSPV